jgi:enoyl-CoA hydratase/carnithine racemase
LVSERATLRLWHTGTTVTLPDDPLACVQDGPIVHVVINRPAKRNAITLQIWRDMAAAMARLAADPAVKLLVLRGAGTQAFSPGADIQEFPEVFRDAESTRSFNAAVRAAQIALERLSKPTLAVIYGPCVGGGCGIALACDLRLAAEDARFGITPSKLGLAYSPPDMKRLVALVGPGRAKDIIYSGRLLSGFEAKDAGLVDFLAPATELEATASRYAMDLLANSQHSIRAAKAIINSVAGIHVRPDEELDRIFEGTFQGHDFREGHAAFIAKRRPRFE